jgi:hypothetical protein
MSGSSRWQPIPILILIGTQPQVAAALGDWPPYWWARHSRNNQLLRANATPSQRLSACPGAGATRAPVKSARLSAPESAVLVSRVHVREGLKPRLRAVVPDPKHGVQVGSRVLDAIASGVEERQDVGVWNSASIALSQASRHDGRATRTARHLATRCRCPAGFRWPGAPLSPWRGTSAEASSRPADRRPGHRTRERTAQPRRGLAAGDPGEVAEPEPSLVRVDGVVAVHLNVVVSAVAQDLATRP